MSEIMVIENGIVITMDEENRVFEDGSVVVEGESIIDVGKTNEIKKRYKGDLVIKARKSAVLPGLINIHNHSAVLRGTGDELPLYEWLAQFVHKPFKVMKPEDAYAAALLTYSEAIKSGTTCIMDMFRFMNRSADAAEEIGIRAVLAPYVSDGLDFVENINDNEKHGSADGRIQVWVGIHSFRDASSELFAKARACANKYKVGIHTHANETLNDIELSRKRHSKRPIEYLYDMGVLGPDVILAHCVWLSESEIRILRDTKTSVAHCPHANMKLADGVAPVNRLVDQTVNVGLGTDGAINNNSIDLFETMKVTSLLQRVNQLNSLIMPANIVLKMATKNGAISLGKDREFGTIEIGKKGDIIIVDLAKPRLTPILFGDYFNVVSHLVYAAHGDDVKTVIINGKVVMKDRVLKTANEDFIIKKATQAAMQLLERSEGASLSNYPP
jgi:5-methylthioadenosine/S-adenosylhomocysteine deaminase